MSEHERNEERDWQTRPILLGVAALFVFIFLGLALSAATVKLVNRYRARTDEPAVFTQRKLPPPPRLQTGEAEDMEAFRRREESILSSYEWIDRPRGVVRIPIERAMELTAREAPGARP